MRFFITTVLFFTSLVLPAMGRRDSLLETIMSDLIRYTIDKTTTQKLIHGHEFNEDWSGALKKDKDISRVHTKLRIPAISPGDGEEGEGDEWAGQAWVGIDGFPCDRGSALRVGVIWKLLQNETKYTAWSQWFPEAKRYFDIAIHTDHEIELEIVAPSHVEGVAKIINHSTGEADDHVFTNKPELLCRDRAEWVVSRVTEPLDNGQERRVRFANYRRIVFQEPGYVSGKHGKHHSSFRSRVLKMGDIKWNFWRSGNKHSRCGYRLLSSDFVCVAFRAYYKHIGDSIHGFH